MSSARVTKDLCAQCGTPHVIEFFRRVEVDRPQCKCGCGETVRRTAEFGRAKRMLQERFREGRDLDAYVETFDPEYESKVSRGTMALALVLGRRWGWFEVRELPRPVFGGLYGAKQAVAS